MKLLFLIFAIYSFGCCFTLLFFMVGRLPGLVERNWPWPVIFLWPLLVFWPVHALAGFFIKRATRKRK